MNYEEMQKESELHGETNDCAIKAIALAAGISYADAAAELKRWGRKHRRGASLNSIHQIMAQTYKCKLVKITELAVQYGRTIKTLGKVLPSDRIFMIFTAKHVLCYKNGKIEDWTEGRLHRIEDVYEVIRPTHRPSLVPQVTMEDEDTFLVDSLFGECANRIAEKHHVSLVTGTYKVPICLLYTSPSPRDRQKSRMPSSA